MHNDCLPDVRWINHDIRNELANAGLWNKFKKAMDKGFAETRKGSSGIIKLKENEVITKKGVQYNFKIKDPGSGYRVYGRIDENGALIFDHLLRKH